MLRIQVFDLGWLNRENPSADLCAHGAVQIVLGERIILDSTPHWYAVSTGSLHLLRTLYKDHTADDPIADHLFPHCGHFMVVADGKLTNIGCKSGLNWWVVHNEKSVTLDFGGPQFTIEPDKWVRAVTKLADEVTDFYAINAPKTLSDPLMEAEWYDAFWKEWRELRSHAGPVRKT
jgi:hypothetical protein